MPADINPLWSDAENLLFLQPPLGINGACGQGSRNGRRHSRGEEEEGHGHDVCHWLLQTARTTGWWGGNCPATLGPHPPDVEQCTLSSDHGNDGFIHPGSAPSTSIMASEDWITGLDNILMTMDN